jgi:hypothetical protein
MPLQFILRAICLTIAPPTNFDGTKHLVLIDAASEEFGKKRCRFAFVERVQSNFAINNSYEFSFNKDSQVLRNFLGRDPGCGRYLVSAK